MAAYDLHIHSGYSSDGELPVAAIVGLCAARGLDAFSLTDHNSVRGVGEAARLARERGIGFVPGIEIDRKIITMHDIKKVDRKSVV